MRPLDPRLVATTRPVRVHLAVTVVAGLLLTALIITQAWLLAHAIAGARTWAAVGTAIAAVAVVAVAKSVLVAAAETASLRSATRVISDLRARLVAHVTRAAALDPTGPSARPDAPGPGELATLAGRGLDGLEDYVARYLPQLVLSAIVPVAVVVVVASADWLSALIVLASIPLIPVFMTLVGWQAQERTEKQWHLLQKLGGHFLDAVEGLPTLAVFRRAKATAALVREVSEEHRTATLSTLRIAFLSAFVLEVISTVAVALVAVEVGVRLLYGNLDLETALLVLIIAPEAYLPLREVGARFHASVEGITAAQRVFAVLDDDPGEPVPSGDRPVADRPEIVLHDVTLRYPGRDRPAVDHLDLRLPPGSRTVVAGPSGAGKSSLVALLLRFCAPTSGTITTTEPDGTPVPLAQVDLDQWRHRVAWVPQHPYLFDASLADNVRLGDPDASDERVARALRLAGLDEVVALLPEGAQTPLGERGSRLSAGQRQRVALARAFLVDAPIVLLDEPTAHLDPATADQIQETVERLAHGRTTLVVAHDQRWTDAGWDVCRLAVPV